jgi:hypothetical protein
MRQSLITIAIAHTPVCQKLHLLMERGVLVLQGEGETGALALRPTSPEKKAVGLRYCPHARKASSKARVPGVPFSMARIARLPLV